MNKLYCKIVIIFLIASCNYDNNKELELNFVKSDTVSLNEFNGSVINFKYKLSTQRNNLIIHQNTAFSLFDLKENMVVKSIDLYETNLVLPEDMLGAVGYDEESQIYALFYPYRKKVIFLSAELEILNEISLASLDNTDQTIFVYGDYFDFSMSDQLIFVGTMLKTSNFDATYYQKSKFVSVFNFKGDLLKQFGEFPESRKKSGFSALSQGLNSTDIDVDKKKFYIKAAAGSPEIIIYDFEGSEIKRGGIESEHIDYNLAPYQGEGLESARIADSFTELKWINDNLFATVAAQVMDERMDRPKSRRIILIEDMANQKLYSKVIDPFQYLVYADEKELRFIRTHPNRDELIMVRLEYALE